ncbi:M16 family metallopeptidase [Gemmatimonas phototrophica]|uniref:M16 family metallopeptidase n=1 Tax=Gemmatimonas phototrophica TaxID=1379270 RepID=UPI0006A71434|nr:pitrilysin family protein [Gemmatimonas phototrophica]
MTAYSLARRLAAACLTATTLATAALAVAASPAPAHAQSRAELDKVLRRKVLANGMEVIVVENHGVPIATLEINVRNGAFTQSPEYAGLAHMYEHMFFKANKDLPTADAFNDRAGELGAVFNGTTQEERVNYYLTLPADSVAGGLSFLASALINPSFRDDELAREKEVVLGEYDRNEAQPGFQWQQRANELLYPGQSSRKNTIGDRKVIANVTPAQMREIQRKYYVPNNCALIVTGDVNPEAIFALAEKVFGAWPRGEDPFKLDPIPPIPALDGNKSSISEEPINAVAVLMQWQGPSVGKDPGATFAADVFSDVLNTPGSTFQKNLVDSGLWLAVGVNYYTLNQVGPISVSGQTTPDKFRAAMAALERELARFNDPTYVSPRELEAVKAQRTVSSAFGIEKASEIAHTIGFWWSVASLDYFMSYTDRMAQQRITDLMRYTSTYIIGKPRVTNVLLSSDARRAIGLTEKELLTPFKAGVKQ